jgi:hypothetical protein
MNKYHEENRLSWNEATIAHNSHKGDQAKFFHDGGNKLYREEKEYPYSTTRCANPNAAGICRKERPISH